jgi:hypothetical protein
MVNGEPKYSKFPFTDRILACGVYFFELEEGQTMLSQYPENEGGKTKQLIDCVKPAIRNGMTLSFTG